MWTLFQTAKLRCWHLTFSSVILVRGVGGKLSKLVYLAPTQDLGQTVSSVNSYCAIILIYLVVRDVNIISVKLRCLHLTFSLVILVRGVGGGQAVQASLSCPRPPPQRNLGQAVSSVNSYCTIILEYLVVRDINIISAKPRCLHPTFSLVTLVRGVGGWFIFPPPRIWVRQCHQSILFAP